MHQLFVITPVKNSWDTTKRTIEAIMASKTNFRFDYTVFNDFSTEINTCRLVALANQLKFELINLKDITQTSSPNYDLILQMARTGAILKNAHLLIIESDVMVRENTIQQLYDYAESLENAGMIAAITTDANGTVNFPYFYAKKFEKGVIFTRKRISFCCSLLTNQLLERFAMDALDPKKDWYDIQVSRRSLRENFYNYLVTSCPVVHLPHSSRPWKLLKYSNPLKYYWLKITKQLGRIKQE
jgi:hypothetical protein